MKCIHRFLGRAGDEGAVGREARTMAGAVPSEFAFVPSDNATQMRADRREVVAISISIPADGCGSTFQFHHAAFAKSELHLPQIASRWNECS